MNLEKTEYINLLSDIYAPLLSPKQQEFLSLYFSEDYSLAEIGEILGISRQAVHDTLRRATTALQTMESQLHILERESRRQALLHELTRLIESSNAVFSEDSLAGEADKGHRQQCLELIRSIYDLSFIREI